MSIKYKNDNLIRLVFSTYYSLLLNLNLFFPMKNLKCY